MKEKFDSLIGWIRTNFGELVRYVIAGGLTTVLSMLISYGVEFWMADKEPFAGGSLLGWIADSINRATAPQVAIANAVSWVIAVLFAFWINRKMVFQVRESKGIWKELLEFAGSRLVSFLVFEEGMAMLLKALEVSNILNRLIVLVFVMVFNYVVSKFWIFKKKNAE